MHTDSEVGQVASMRFSVGFSGTVEKEAPGTNDSHQHFNEIQPLVVDKTTLPSSSPFPGPHLVVHPYIGRKSTGMGGTLLKPVSARKMAIQCGRDDFQ